MKSLYRRDQTINLCECKFSIAEFTIDRSYAEKLRNKISNFKETTKTKKAIFLTCITTYGVKHNEYHGMVQNDLHMDILFE